MKIFKVIYQVGLFGTELPPVTTGVAAQVDAELARREGVKAAPPPKAPVPENGFVSYGPELHALVAAPAAALCGGVIGAQLKVDEFHGIHIVSCSNIVDGPVFGIEEEPEPLPPPTQTAPVAPPPAPPMRPPVVAPPPPPSHP